jgi:hypothetical protein
MSALLVQMPLGLERMLEVGFRCLQHPQIHERGSLRVEAHQKSKCGIKLREIKAHARIKKVVAAWAESTPRSLTCSETTEINCYWPEALSYCVRASSRCALPSRAMHRSLRPLSESML